MLLIVALCLLAPLEARRGGKKPPPSDAVCTTKGCVLAANQLITAMNTSVDPCENFFEFACGQWIRDHPIPDDRGRHDSIEHVQDKITQQLKGLFQSSAPIESKAMDMVRTVYKACMNETQLALLKSTPLLSELESVGGWPLLGVKPCKATEFDLTGLLGVTRREFGAEPFFVTYIDADDRNTTRNIIKLSQAKPTLARELFLNTTMFASQLAAYKKFQRKVVELLIEDGNYSPCEADIEADLSKMLEFETKFAKITVPDEDRRNSTRLYNMRRIGDLASLLPKVDWLRFFHTISPPEIHELINNDTELIVREDLGFFKNLTALLEGTDERIIQNFIIWQVVITAKNLLDSRVDDVIQDLMKALIGQEKKPTRWKFCVEKARDSFKFAAGAIYIKEYFDPKEKEEASEMVENFKEALEQIIKGSDWMDQATKKVAVEKLHGIISTIGYPDFITNSTALDEYYAKLDLQPSDPYFTLSRKLTVWSQEYYFMKLTEDFDRAEFNDNPAVVNAHYNSVMNSITFPAGILQPPFFSEDFPKMINYGAIGSVIGHEITHGFDDQGSQYDKDGNLRNWWSAQSEKKFADRTKCIVDQYSSYELPSLGVKVNGKLTQGENIADNGGLKEAYNAYRKYVKKLGHEEPRLPGLQEFSNDQIFFVSFANMWCGSSKEQTAIQDILTDPHSPYMYRVIGVLSNFKEFSKAFKCARGMPLNPEKQCSVW